MAKKISASAFATFLIKRANAKDGYIMGSKGQNPKKWAKTSWWFTQYSGSQRTKALYWREHAARVWDCNGMAEGYYEEQTGVNINTKARYNYSGWCSPKGTGKIPNKHKVRGAAVFIHNGSYISHVGFLVEPINAEKPAGDWWVVEARGVMYGVVTTKLSARGWNRWGLMTKYFDYDGAATEPVSYQLGERVLKKGLIGDDVQELQTILLSFSYDLGSYGADGDFGAKTQAAVMSFQKANGLPGDGVYGPTTHEKLVSLLKQDQPGGTEDETPGDAEEEPEATGEEDPTKDTDRYVLVTGSTVNVRTQPNTGGKIVFVAKKGDQLAYAGMTSPEGWYCVAAQGESAWISGQYAVLVDIPDSAQPPTGETTPVDDARAIVDISAYQTIKDAAAAAKVAKNVKLVIHRASVGSNPDKKWPAHAKLMKNAGIAYGVYHYVKATTAAQARQEAKLFYAQASPHDPIFYVADMEWSGIAKGKARTVCSAFIAELKKLGAKKTGIYVGHHLYKLWNLNYDEVDFTWIPRYGDKKTNMAGKPGKWPAYPCTLHQYSSGGSVPGITGRVDMNRITGKQLTFEQLVARA